VTLTKIGDGFAITRIDLETAAEIPGIDDATFQRIALGAMAGRLTRTQRSRTT
jgi:lipoyl-dependent peroxiredoxin